MNKDYIMRLIEQIFDFIAAISGLKRLGKFLEARQMIQKICKSKFGINEEMIKGLMYKDLMGILSGGSEIDTEKCAVFAKLLKEEAIILKEQNEGDKGFNHFTKSLNIFIELDLDGGDVKEIDFDKEIEDILNHIKEYEYTNETKELLFQYYEKKNMYGKVEDILFELLNEEEKSEKIIEKGLNFYKRLMEKDEKELLEGNLPIEEVIEGNNYLTNYSGGQV